ncbi:MAG: ATP-binding protein, partial [Chloroflexota bacterium]|nr:ATP-binding protein [Chloroflexota bacterium]
LLQAQKMEAVGRLAGGVAHDFNNLLTAITGYTSLLLRNLGEDDPLRGDVEEIKKAAHRAASLTGQLLAFSRRQMLQPKMLDLNTVITSMEAMLRRLIREDIKLVTVLAPDLGYVKADPGQIEQVIMNLAVNARDAMPQGGKLTIETVNTYLDEDYAVQAVDVQAGPYVMIEVTDTGVGMDEEILSHIFEPFFTTKGLGKGTGLGLATVHGIIKQSGGHIEVYSEPERVTTFRIYLPQVEGEIEQVEQVQIPLESLLGSETILLVEDADIVRALARVVLHRNGYNVLEASHGREALLVCEQHDGPIHLLVTDVVMPEMGGRELAEHLTALHPEMKVLYASGYTDDAIVHRDVFERDTAFLQKPFTPEALMRKVREVLDISC